VSEAEERERKQQLAWNPHTALDRLVELAEDPDPYVRAAAAQNAPDWLLRKMASDGRAQVRAAVAANPITPDDVLREMVTDRSKLVRFWLTVQTDRALLRELARDPDELTASAARSALDGKRLYRRLINAPFEALAKRAVRRIEGHADQRPR
jgi:hypothetical protein